MPPGDSLQLTRIQRKLQRELRAREEAERISERVTRELYDRGRELELLEAVAKASNEAQSIEAAFQVALNGLCEHTGWPVGHAYVCDGESVMQPTGIWYLAHRQRFRELCRVTAETSFRRGEGLPGRILASGQPAWIENVMKETNFPRARHAADIGVGAAFGFPVLIGDEVAAVLEFFTAVPVEPDDAVLRLAAQIGNQLGRVVERVRSEERLSHQATHDPLTGLPNRVLILDHLGYELARLERSPTVHLAVLFLDLDGFKQVNDTIGHAGGDEVLREVARRLNSVRRKSDILGRLSGDEFVLICPDLPREFTAARICERLFGMFADDFVVGNDNFRLSASIGVAFCSAGDGSTPDRLIQRADAAMYRAKKQPGPAFVAFDSVLEEQITARVALERALRLAIEGDELFLVYQPQVSVADGRIVGIEALVRWRRPDGVLMPIDFIPIAEETGMIVPLGAWVLREACRQTAQWRRDLGDDAPWVSVNMSVRQLSDPSTVATVASALHAHPEVAGRLYFEVTESVLLEDAEGGLKVLGQLKQLGTEIAIDDFGTGYASLSYLRRFPASAVKIDGSFVSDMDSNPAALAIVSSVVDLAHALGLQAVAEGVETEAQLEELRRLQCDLVQGFYVARPAQAHELAPFLDPAYRAWSAGDAQVVAPVADV